MPEFILNKPAKRKHAFYSLDEFAQAYVEAMIFTNCDSISDNEWEANNLGVERLTRMSVASIKADCDNFQVQAAKEIAETLSFGKLDLESIGRDFWFTRQGHGVGFWEGESRGYPESVKGELSRIAEGFGESYPEIYRGWIHYR